MAAAAISGAKFSSSIGLRHLHMDTRSHAHTHARTHECTRARTHARTHAHTHTHDDE